MGIKAGFHLVRLDKNHRSHPRKAPHIQSRSERGGKVGAGAGGGLGRGMVFTFRAAPRCAQQVCGSAERALFTATGVCLCCCVRPFRSRTVAGFFSGLALNEGLPVFWPDRPNSPPFLCALPIPPCSFLFAFFAPPSLPKKAATLCI